jgi:Flp pilus assembly pilin Flp
MPKFKMNQKGQGMLEYIILTGLIGIFCLATFKSLGKSLKTRVKNINTKITKELTIN